MLMPPWVINTTWFWPSVSFTAINASSGSIVIAMIPPLRTLANSESAVFFTVPCRVAKNSNPGCCQVTSSLVGLVREITRIKAAIFSSGFNSSRFAMLRPFRRPAHVRNLVHPLDVNPAGVREEHQVIVRAGGEQVLDEIRRLALERRHLARGHPDHPLAAAALSPIGTDIGPFDQAVVRDGDDHSLVGDQVLDRDLALVRHQVRRRAVAYFS
jgi:hypothetical protein